MAGKSKEIEHELAEQAGVYAAVEETAKHIVLSGLIGSEQQRQAALDIAASIVPGKHIIDNLEVSDVMPESLGGMHVSTASVGAFRGATPGTSDSEGIEPGDYTDQEILSNASGAAGPAGTTEDEDISEGEEAYVPATDPVMTRKGEFLGGFKLSSDDSVEVELSTLGQPMSDGSIAAAIRHELEEDAATAELDIHVSVENGVAELRGQVATLEDAENAEAVAARVPGVVEVKESLDVQHLGLNRS